MNPDNENFRDWSVGRRGLLFWLLTGFGSGLIKKAPGTWGSLVALLIAVLMIETGTDVIELFSWTLGLYILSVMKLKTIEAESGIHDAPEIVSDEFVGMWITLLPVAYLGGGPLSYIVGFALFRLFDIVKPGPIGWLDRNITGATGVMVDDVAAGAVSAAILWAILKYVPPFPLL